MYVKYRSFQSLIKFAKYRKCLIINYFLNILSGFEPGCRGFESLRAHQNVLGCLISLMLIKAS